MTLGTRGVGIEVSPRALSNMVAHLFLPFLVAAAVFRGHCQASVPPEAALQQPLWEEIARNFPGGDYQGTNGRFGHTLCTDSKDVLVVLAGQQGTLKPSDCSPEKDDGQCVFSVLSLPTLFIFPPSPVFPSVVISSDLGVSWKEPTSSAAWGKRKYHACTTFKGTVYMSGGYSVNGGICGGHPYAYDEVYSFETYYAAEEASSSGLSVNASLHSRGPRNAEYFPARYGHGFLVFNGDMYVMAGQGLNSPHSFNDVWKAKDRDNWFQVTVEGPNKPNAPWRGRHGAAIATFNGKIEQLTGCNHVVHMPGVAALW